MLSAAAQREVVEAAVEGRLPRGYGFKRLVDRGPSNGCSGYCRQHEHKIHTLRRRQPRRADFLVVDAVWPNRSAADEFPANREKNREIFKFRPRSLKITLNLVVIS
jgi:hypothetical protein